MVKCNQLVCRWHAFTILIIYAFKIVTREESRLTTARSITRQHACRFCLLIDEAPIIVFEDEKALIARDEGRSWRFQKVHSHHLRLMLLSLLLKAIDANGAATLRGTHCIKVVRLRAGGLLSLMMLLKLSLDVEEAVHGPRCCLLLLLVTLLERESLACLDNTHEAEVLYLLEGRLWHLQLLHLDLRHLPALLLARRLPYHRQVKFARVR